jgi:hypothetical protein
VVRLAVKPQNHSMKAAATTRRAPVSQFSHPQNRLKFAQWLRNGFGRSEAKLWSAASIWRNSACRSSVASSIRNSRALRPLFQLRHFPSLLPPLAHQNNNLATFDNYFKFKGVSE